MSMSSHQKYLDVSTMLRIGCSLIDCNQIQRRRSSCGARPCSRRQHRLLTATLTVGLTTVSPVSLVRDPVIFVDSDLMVALMCVARCRAASQHCVNFSASAISSQRPSSSRPSLPWFCVDSTMVMAHWSASRPTLSVDSSQCRTRDRCSLFRLRRIDLTTSQMHSSACI